LVYSARNVDLHQSLAALLLAVCPSWLRDHQALPGSGRKIVATHNQKISARGAFADQRKHHPTDMSFNCATSLAVFWNAQHRLTNS
jgi:hypothetical protein